MIFASTTPSRAAELINNEVVSTKWVDAMKPPFDAPSELSHIDRSQLQSIRLLTPNVEVVRYDGMHYVHKFMGYTSQPSSFEKEIMHHKRVLGSRFVPRLCNVVTFNGENHGLLLEFIDGGNLSDLSSSIERSQLSRVSATILEAIEDFESRGYYPQDLKCGNIVLHNCDWSLFVVDLGGGFSEYMHLKEAIPADAQ